MLYPDLPELTRDILARGRHIYLCTNGMFLRKKIHEYAPDPKLFINVHLDGMEKSHDLAVEREGVFQAAVDGIQAAKEAGFKVCTNTTVYKETNMDEIAELFEYLKQFGVDTHMLAPAYGYSAVNDREIFMTREDIHEKFKDVEELGRKYPLSTTPVYQDFLRGERELPCTAWGNPTYNIRGWKGPCYLITDAHYETFEELMTKTHWETYGAGADHRCEHCMVHCGFEPSAALGINSKFSDNFRMLSWVLR
jgi:hopanoid biosynthesis associated radical SAM protein HpnH